jgi:hypothetical protein
MATVEFHNQEMQENLKSWRRKPVLRKIYRDFHQIIAHHLSDLPLGSVVELGSGITDIREVIPDCIRTDIFPDPWIDRVENAYDLSFADESVSDLILFDVFHHLRYPGTALREFHRVLPVRGRVLVFEPYISLLGLIVYGLLHKEPLGLRAQIRWEAPAGWNPADLDYYAAQTNATRIFVRREVDIHALGWNLITLKRLCSISYVASGGYSRPQMYPDCVFGAVQYLDKVFSVLPHVFGTRLLAVLEKTACVKPAYVYTHQVS